MGDAIYLQGAYGAQQGDACDDPDTVDGTWGVNHPVLAVIIWDYQRQKSDSFNGSQSSCSLFHL